MFRSIVIVTLIFLASCPAAWAREEAGNEYDVKAAYIVKFAQYVEWPDSAFANRESPLCIGVLGDDPFGVALDAAVAGAAANGRPLVVRRSQRKEELKGCQLLFISKSEQAQVNRVLEALDDASILTVSEIEGFVGRGGVVELVVEGDKVRFKIDFAAARRRRLDISPKLLLAAKGAADSR